MAKETERLADFASATQLADIPSPVLDRMKLLILDQLGVQLATAQLPWNASVRNYSMRYSAPGQSTVVGASTKLDAEFAALANATAGHGFEFDDYHPAPTHIGCVAVPSSLAVAEEQKVSGAEFLLATTLAFEVISRVAKATMPSMIFDRGFHATAAHGVFGAAVSAARMMGLSRHTILMALSLAGSHASGTVEYTQTGGEVKRFHAGIGAAGGIRSARAAAMGMTGPPTILEGRKGYLQAFSAEPSPEELVSGLGESWELMDTAIKPYPVCGALNPLIDALGDIMTTHDLVADDLERVTVGVDRFVKDHVGTIGPEPHDTTGAQFSAHYSLGMTAVLRRNDFGAYQHVTQAAFDTPEIIDVAKRVDVLIDEECDSEWPRLFLTKVKVSTRDGQVYEGSGRPHGPVIREQVLDKFRGTAGTALDASRVEDLIARVEGLQDLPAVEELGALIGLLDTPEEAPKAPA